MHNVAFVPLNIIVFASAFSKTVPTNPLSGINAYVPLHSFDIDSNKG
jgi:hypothetical protein